MAATRLAMTLVELRVHNKPMNRSHRCVCILLVHDQADAALARPLRDGDDVDPLRTQRAKDAPGDTRRVANRTNV